MVISSVTFVAGNGGILIFVTTLMGNQLRILLNANACVLNVSANAVNVWMTVVTIVGKLANNVVVKDA